MWAADDNSYGNSLEVHIFASLKMWLLASIGETFSGNGTGKFVSSRVQIGICAFFCETFNIVQTIKLEQLYDVE